jgi:hypothetical protein
VLVLITPVFNNSTIIFSASFFSFLFISKNFFIKSVKGDQVHREYTRIAAKKRKIKQENHYN